MSRIVLLLLSVLASASWVQCRARSPQPDGGSSAHLRSTRTGASSSFLLRGDDYVHFPGVGYYKLHDYDVKFCIANQICQEEGAHLMVINSEKEAEVVKKLFQKFPTLRGNNNWVYVGLHEKGKNGEYFSVLGERLEDTGFTRWGAGYPNKAGPSECVVVRRDTAELADDPCDLSYGFICEHFDRHDMEANNVELLQRAPTKVDNDDTASSGVPVEE